MFRNLLFGALVSAMIGAGTAAQTLEVCNTGRGYSWPYEPFPVKRAVVCEIYDGNGGLISRSDTPIAVGECQEYVFGGGGQSITLYFEGDSAGSGMSWARQEFARDHKLSVYADRVEVAFYHEAHDSWAYDSYDDWPNPAAFGVGEDGAEPDDDDAGGEGAAGEPANGSGDATDESDQVATGDTAPVAITFEKLAGSDRALVAGIYTSPALTSDSLVGERVFIDSSERTAVGFYDIPAGTTSLWLEIELRDANGTSCQTRSERRIQVDVGEVEDAVVQWEVEACYAAWSGTFGREGDMVHAERMVPCDIDALHGELGEEGEAGGGSACGATSPATIAILCLALAGLRLVHAARRGNVG
ncbi:MAG: hypothetical protein JSV19_08590 [Phycisphaerales bacterium]|nr:MAG: hypothetical protein JSV19_08590 [Phycisphaerales bacterium]